jgi:trimethylamine--corrinoid protein Co-methyltransferase
MGAIETMMIDASYAQIGKTLGLPVHAYMGLSDAKTVDAQSGLESGIGAILAALAGVNVISGPGMLNFESCQSLEKLVVDHEICGMAHRLVRGVEPRGDRLAPDLLGDIYDGEHFVGSEETIRWFREELYAPGEVIDRETYEIWKSKDQETAWERAKSEVTRILESHEEEEPLPGDILRELDSIASRDGRSNGLDMMPSLPELKS